MGCGASSLRGDGVPSIDTTAKPAYMRRLSSPQELFQSAPKPKTEHYQTAAEHERDLQRLESQQRRTSRPAYVDPNDLPMPPKTTHQRYHRRQSENPEEKVDVNSGGYRERLNKARERVLSPAEIREQMAQIRMRKDRDGDGTGVVVSNKQRHRSFIG